MGPNHIVSERERKGKLCLQMLRDRNSNREDGRKAIIDDRSTTCRTNDRVEGPIPEGGGEDDEEEITDLMIDICLTSSLNDNEIRR